MAFVLILCAVVAVVLLWKYITGGKNIWQEQNVHYVEVSNLVGTLDRFLQKISFHEFDRRIYEAVGNQPYYGYMDFGRPVLGLKDLDLVKQILIKDFDYFPDRAKMNFLSSDVYFSRMLHNASGKEWKGLRTTMSPTFTSGKIRRMFQHINTCGDNLNAYLRNKYDNGKDVVNFHDAFGRFTLAAISLIAFGQPSDTFEDNSVFRNMANKLSAPTYRNFLWFFVPKLAKFLRVSQQDKESTEFFRTIIERNIRQRRIQGDKGNKHNDFLQLLLEAQEGGKLEADETEARTEGKTPLDDATVVAQCILFFFAGTDTQKSALTYTSYELALDQEVQDKLVKEVKTALAKNNGVLSYEAVSDMQYLEAVMTEAMRLHPPAFATVRECERDYVLPGTKVKIPKGTRIHIPIRQYGHDAKLFPNPMKFNPDNFSTENKAKRHPLASLPFGDGPRNCIASRFAMIEAKAAIANLISQFKLETCDKTEIPISEVNTGASTTAANGCYLRITPRN